MFFYFLFLKRKNKEILQAEQSQFIFGPKYFHLFYTYGKCDPATDSNKIFLSEYSLHWNYYILKSWHANP